jgi:hypothetical protein
MMILKYAGSTPADCGELYLQLPAGQLNGPWPRLNLDL